MSAATALCSLRSLWIYQNATGVCTCWRNIIAMCAMKVPFELHVIHASTLVAGKRLVGGEGVYKDRGSMRFFFFFFTHCFLRFTKRLSTAWDGVTKREILLNDDCGVARLFKNNNTRADGSVSPASSHYTDTHQIPQSHFRKPISPPSQTEHPQSPHPPLYTTPSPPP